MLGSNVDIDFALLLLAVTGLSIAVGSLLYERINARKGDKDLK